jgi:catechol 2,3-dioxygenase-like lactoylglutathione lyase family enzyme
MPLRTTKHWFGVVLDCPDASELAHFYQRLLGWTLFKDTPGWATLAPSETPGYNLAFQQEPNYVRPVWPSEPGQPLMMLHLDLEVDDLEVAVAYAIEVGAQQAEFQPQTDVRVMLDPAGHPFCLYVDSEADDTGEGASESS